MAKTHSIFARITVKGTRCDRWVAKLWPLGGEFNHVEVRAKRSLPASYNLVYRRLSGFRGISIDIALMLNVILASEMSKLFDFLVIEFKEISLCASILN